jgi:hypothetical protein
MQKKFFHKISFGPFSSLEWDDAVNHLQSLGERLYDDMGFDETLPYIIFVAGRWIGSSDPAGGEDKFNLDDLLRITELF